MNGDKGSYNKEMWKPYAEYVESPCVNICTLVDSGIEDVCVGCGRTAEEIESYPISTNTEKALINEKALKRLETI